MGNVLGVDAPHLTKYFDEMAKQHEDMLKGVGVPNRLLTMSPEMLEKQTATAKRFVARKKAGMVDRLKVHARDSFAHHDADDSGFLDTEESKVCGCGLQEQNLFECSPASLASAKALIDTFLFTLL